MDGPIASPKHENHKQGDHATYKQPQRCVVSGRHSAFQLRAARTWRGLMPTAQLVDVFALDANANITF
jgi:hypothetical protein